MANNETSINKKSSLLPKEKRIIDSFLRYLVTILNTFIHQIILRSAFRANINSLYVLQIHHKVIIPRKLQVLLRYAEERKLIEEIDKGKGKQISLQKRSIS